MRIIKSLTSFVEFLDFTYKDEITFITASSNFICSNQFESVLIANNVSKGNSLVPVASYHSNISQYHIASFFTQQPQMFPSLIGATHYGNNILFVIDSKTTIEPTLSLFFKKINLEEAIKEAKKSSNEFSISEEFINANLRENFVKQLAATNSLRKMLDNVVFKREDFDYIKSIVNEENYMKILSTLRFESFDTDPHHHISSNISFVYHQLFDYARKNPKRGKVFLNRFIVGVNNNIENKISKESLLEVFSEDEVSKLSQHLNSIYTSSSVCINDVILKNYETPESFIFSYYKSFLNGIPKSMQKFIDSNILHFIEASLGEHQYLIVQVINSKHINKAYICSPMYKSTALISDKVFMQTFANIVSNLINIPGFYDDLKNKVTSENISKLNSIYSAKKEMLDDVLIQPKVKTKVNKF